MFHKKWFLVYLSFISSVLSEHIDAEDWTDVELRDVRDAEGLADGCEAVPVGGTVEIDADSECAWDGEPEYALDVEC